ncbi:MAG: hypothetical protein AAF404_03220 [Pseudomonadota bacterium]
MILQTTQLQIGDFSFLIEKDRGADPISGVAVWVLFRDEPCCDDNGHQYRIFLPLGVNDDTIRDVCHAFTLATHCEQLDLAA